VTLHQIIDVYLRLCHNDGIDSPEPLYLTLSTKLTIPAEISDLLQAASEGKGLSEINLWDGYQEADEELEEGSEAHGQKEEPVSPNHPTTNQNIVARELQVASDEAESHHEIQDNEKTSQAQELADDDTSSSAKQGVAPTTSVQEDELHEEGEVEEANDPELDRDTAGNEEAAHEESYDSEEQQTDTTVTVAHLPGADLNDELENEDGSASPVHNDRTDRGLEGEHSEIDYSDEEEIPERKDPLEPVVNEGSRRGDDERQDGGFVDPGVEDHSTEQHGLSSIDDAIDIVEGHGHDLEEGFNADDGDHLHKDSVSVPNPRVPEKEGRDTPDPADDALGFVEDQFESPSKVSKNEDEIIDDTSEFGDDHHEFKDDTPAEISHEHDDELPLDDEEYIDLGFADGLDTVDERPASGSRSLDNGASKRSREPEDESDFAENPSPDLKRSRSS
jgi:hypothetical protein